MAPEAWLRVTHGGQLAFHEDLESDSEVGILPESQGSECMRLIQAVQLREPDIAPVENHGSIGLTLQLALSGDVVHDGGVCLGCHVLIEGQVEAFGLGTLASLGFRESQAIKGSTPCVTLEGEGDNAELETSPAFTFLGLQHGLDPAHVGDRGFHLGQGLARIAVARVVARQGGNDRGGEHHGGQDFGKMHCDGAADERVLQLRRDQLVDPKTSCFPRKRQRV